MTRPFTAVIYLNEDDRDGEIFSQHRGRYLDWRDTHDDYGHRSQSEAEAVTKVLGRKLFLNNTTNPFLLSLSQSETLPPQPILSETPSYLTNTLRPTNNHRHGLRPSRPWTKQVPPRPSRLLLTMTPQTAPTRAESGQRRDRWRLLDLEPRIPMALDIIIR